MRPEELTPFIKQTALDLGFSFCGMSKAEFLEEEAPRLENWLSQGHHGTMKYLENHFDKRLDPRLLVPGAKSIISLLYNYYPKEDLTREDNFKVAKYAYGEDYHDVIREKLNIFLERISERVGHVEGRAFVDAAPVMERAWAARSGLGWIGKNTLLLNKERGSFFFLAELITDLVVEPDAPVRDYCGTCTACQDACPTDAIPTPYTLDASRCISYFTIELKESIPESMKGKFENWIFGCDICQDVCPWNRFSTPHHEPRFNPPPGVKDMSRNEWVELTEETFGRVFGKSAMTRAKFRGVSRNIRFVS